MMAQAKVTKIYQAILDQLNRFKTKKIESAKTIAKPQ